MPIPIASVSLTGARQVVQLTVNPDVFDRVLVGNSSDLLLDIDCGSSKVRIQPLNVDVVPLNSTLLTLNPTATGASQIAQPMLELQLVRKDEELAGSYPQTISNPNQPSVTRWSINHTPAAGVKATVTRAAAPGVTHVADICIATLAQSTGVAGNDQFSIIDGPSGGATLLLTGSVSITATSGATDRIIAGPGLGLKGTTGNAMTIEYLVLFALALESVTLVGYDQ